MADAPLKPSDVPSGATTPALIAGNSAVPIRLTDIKISGFAAESAVQGQVIKVWSRLGVTSDDPQFHRIIRNFSSFVASAALRAGIAVDLDRINMVLLVIRPDDSGELWLDTAAIAINALMKHDVKAGMPIFESDIADIIGLGFPAVQIGANDGVICVFRQDWRFGLFFDLAKDGKLSPEAMTRELGRLYRVLKYRHIYDTIENSAIFDPLVAAGWFPFAEVVATDLTGILNAAEAGFNLAEAEQQLVAKFTPDRVEGMLHRWLTKPHLASREKLLRSALQGFLAGDPVATIKILLTEIEGMLRDAYRAQFGKGAPLKQLLEFAVQSAERKAGSPNTLLLPTAFATYLANHTFEHFDPLKHSGTAGSRHAVGHGAAAADTYTPARALQAILTLDQLAFYT